MSARVGVSLVKLSREVEKGHYDELMVI